MRILVINADYAGFLASLYAGTEGLEGASYDEQMLARNRSLFGVADFYSHNLRALGHEAWEVHANNRPLQAAWAREHGLRLEEPGAKRWSFRLRGGLVPWVSRVVDRRWIYHALAAQIRHYRPDVILNQALDAIDARFLGSMKGHTRLLVGQVAAPLGNEHGLGNYDLILSSLPNFVARFRAMGIASELHRFAFDARVLDVLGEADALPRERSVPVSFVGSISRHHDARTRLLESLHRQGRLALWGKGAELLAGSPLREIHNGEAWGAEMYRVLAASRITLNHHIGIAEGYANNMRLFEATGMGTLLLTDWKENLGEMFEVGREVVAYRSPDECAEMIEHYLNNDDERARIAAAGQARTLSEHSFANRMKELADVFETSLRRMPRAGGYQAATQTHADAAGDDATDDGATGDGATGDGATSDGATGDREAGAGGAA